MGKTKHTGVVSAEQITHSILVFRGHKVLLDSDLAELIGVPTKAFNQAVKRSAKRFPEDSMFRLSQAEAEALNRSQLVTGSQNHRDPRFPPSAFTERGTMMAAMILNSPRAVETSVYVVRAFVELRELLACAGAGRQNNNPPRAHHPRGTAYTVPTARAVAITRDYLGGEVVVAGVSAVDPAPSTFTSPGLLTTNITTRRFWARPSAVLLLAAGCVGP